MAEETTRQARSNRRRRPKNPPSNWSKAIQAYALLQKARNPRFKLDLPRAVKDPEVHNIYYGLQESKGRYNRAFQDIARCAYTEDCGPDEYKRLASQLQALRETKAPADFLQGIERRRAQRGRRRARKANNMCTGLDVTACDNEIDNCTWHGGVQNRCQILPLGTRSRTKREFEQYKDIDSCYDHNGIWVEPEGSEGYCRRNPYTREAVEARRAERAQAAGRGGGARAAGARANAFDDDGYAYDNQYDGDDTYDW